jgi:2-polyprenyl-3-methyl-5-hydroxy-6-metoxy-1,4-benzoquinol methylase
MGTCDLCGGECVSLGPQEGYREGTFFEVLACARCGSSTVTPRRSDPGVYEAIYRNVDTIPGYCRYAQYAREVLRSRDPLQFLMDAEDCYWAVGAEIRARPEGLVVELGCGHGYLTYALRRAGVNALGFDLSSTAIAAARRRFGDFYHAEDVVGFLERTGQRARHIVLTEVVEHLEDPAGLLSGLARCLSPGGSLLVTTPNRAGWPQATWNTDLPPVHLWWFTYAGMQALAKQVGARVELLDLAEFYRRNVVIRDPGTGKREPILGANGEPRRLLAPGGSGWRSALQHVPPWEAVRAARALVRTARARKSRLPLFSAEVPSSLCVKLVPIG